MRHVLSLAVAVAALVAGCTEDLNPPASGTRSPCPLPPIDLSGTIEEVHASELLVDARGRLEGPVVLHIRDETTLYLRDGLSCSPGTLAQVAAGMTFEAAADGPVMESYPPQTVPSIVFVDLRQ